MRVFVAGATGAIGRPLLARLAAAGHEVTAMTRSPERAAALRAHGHEAVVADAFDAPAVHAAVGAAQPEVVVNQLTALAPSFDPRRYGEWLAETNRLRREAAPVLVGAARAAGARRVVAQSISFIASPRAPAIASEADPVWTEAPEPIGGGVSSALALERAVTEAEGIEGLVLRYGYFYGPGTTYGPGGSIVADVRRRRFPVVGSGAGRFSFVHVDDAADATVLALTAGTTGVYNVVDDDPAPMREWLPALAAAAGAPKPLRVPAFVGRLAAGRYAVLYATVQRGASNAKARRELGWAPAHPSWRTGFPAVFGAQAE